MAAAESRFRVMGSEAHVIVTGGRSSQSRRARSLLEQLELRWSRFLAESDVSRVNRAAGAPVRVHADTLRLFETARLGWEITGGRFDPTVLRTVIARGYRRTLDDGMPTVDWSATAPATGLGAVHVDRRRGTVQVEPGAGFDPGAIGKGLAADMVVQDLLGAGAAGVMVGIGGDLRVAGDAPQGGPWSVTVEHPLDRTAEVAVLHVSDGGVATSTARHGRWTNGGEAVCHVIEPRTGEVVETDAASVTVVAAEGWMAEVVATGALLAGVEAGLRLVDDLGLHGLVVDRAGTVHGSVRMEVPA